VQVAQIRTEGDLKKTEMVVATDQARIARDIDRDRAYVEAENERTKTTGIVKMAELELRRELLIMELAQRDKLSIETIKAQLAMKGADLDLNRELAQFGHLSAQEARVTDGELAKQQAVVESAVEKIEPPGRAPAGYGDSL